MRPTISQTARVTDVRFQIDQRGAIVNETHGGDTLTLAVKPAILRGCHTGEMLLVR